MDVQQSDYVIVGAGSAGCVLANRLSESGQDRVTLLEAGQASHPLSTVPMSFAFLIDDPAANWRYRSTPEEITHNREIPIPRGKLLGGSSAIAADGEALYKANTCWSCHGKDAKTPIMPTYPSLAGQNADYAFNQMKDIKSGARANGGAAAMKGVMGLVNEEEMRAIADWLATLK